MAQQQECQIETQVRPYKYKIEQSSKGARVTVHGDTIADIVEDYRILRERLQESGFRIASEE